MDFGEEKYREDMGVNKVKDEKGYIITDLTEIYKDIQQIQDGRLEPLALTNFPCGLNQNTWRAAQKFRLAWRNSWHLRQRKWGIPRTNDATT